MRSLASILFLFPFYAGSMIGNKVAAALAVLGLAAGLWWGPPERLAARVGRYALMGVCAYLLGGLLVLWPFNRALADFRGWYAKGAGLVVGMTREDIAEVLSTRCRFTLQDEGEWLSYNLEPTGRAGMHPYLGVSDADLFVIHVRFDPQTKLAMEVARVGE